MADRPTVTVQRTGWGLSLPALLAPACRPTLDLGEVAGMVRAGRAHAWTARAAGADVGALVAKIEDHGDHQALYVVIQRFQRMAGLVWTDLIVPGVLEPEARRLGCAEILAHVERPGMARRLRGHGFRPVAGTLYRKAI